jgi:hypothetical protein
MPHTILVLLFSASRVQYGYRRLHILLQREGWQVGHTLIYRLTKRKACRFDVVVLDAIEAARPEWNEQRRLVSMRLGVWISWRISCLTGSDFGC